MARIEIYDAGLGELFHDPDGDVATIMTKAAYAVENRAKSELLAPGSGRTYTRRLYYTRRGGEMFLRQDGSRPPHTASAPGEPASSDYGELLASVTHEMEEGLDGMEAVVGSPLAHALYTELGTREVPPPGPGEPGHHGMVERPWLRPALDVLKVTDLS